MTQRRKALEPATATTAEVLGVDLGIVNLATDSDGQVFSGAQVKRVRARYHTRRRRLQQVNTKNAKRRLRKNAGKERCFQKDVNHCISKALVTKAAISCKALAREDLTGIREAVRAAFQGLLPPPPVSQLQSRLGGHATTSGRPQEYQPDV